jgi:transcription elongation factor SPT5
VVTWPADYAGRFIPGVVVRLSSGAQGYVTSVGPGGASFKVKIGAVRHRDGVEVLESVPKNAEEETVTESELEIVAPENKSHIIVVAEKDSQVARGETGQLVSIDGVDGVIRVNSSGDVVILDMSCLARYWHEQ